MNLLLDTSVLLAACGRADGASGYIVRQSQTRQWALISTPYIVDEVNRNAPKFGPHAETAWTAFQLMLIVKDDVWTLDRPVIFEASKDRPVLFAAAAYADVLLTLDRRDFRNLIGTTFYNLMVTTPGLFLEGQMP